ncbi:MAG: Ig-like domain-containing protein, partial [Deltaproteobacteria bacterium]|nr:Ig-like domain-containing protein [Deltaproteobacteria bacterium]
MRSVLLLATLALTTLLSCHDPLNLPPVQGPPLSAPTRGEPDPSVPLRVLYVSPEGEAGSRHIQLTATFNKAIVPLTHVEKRAEVMPLRLEPSVEGSQRWLSSRTVTFTAKKPLPGSSRFTAVLAAGLKALDGTTLAEEKRWSFVTERLAVSRHDLPYRARRWAKPDQRIRLIFNQPVDAEEAAKHVFFYATPKSAIKTTAKIDAADATPLKIAARGRRGSWARNHTRLDPRVVIIWPTKPLPLHARITLRVEPGLVGGSGPLAMKRKHEARFTTYGPFHVKKLTNTTNFPPEDSVRLSFTTPVVPRNAMAVLRVNGKRLKQKRVSHYPSNTLYLPLSLRPRKRYVITFNGPLRDRFGQALKDIPKLTFTTGDYPAYAKLPVDSGVLEAHGPKNLPLLFRNTESATLYHKRLNPAEIATLANARDPSKNEPRYAKLSGIKARPLAVKRPPNKGFVVRVPLQRLAGSVGHGVLALELHSTLRNRDLGKKPRKKIARSIVRITDLGVMAKYSPHASLVWVTSLKSGKPVAGCDVSIWRQGEAEARWRGKTDTHGLARAPGALELSPKATDKLSYVFMAQKGDDLSYTLSTTQAGIRPWDFNLDETWEAGEEGYKGMVFTDRGLYRPGQKAHLKGIVRRLDEKRLALVSGEVSVIVRDARGENVLETKRELTAFGTFHLKVPIPAAAPLGRFSVSVKRGKTAVAQGSFRVEEYRAAEFAVEAKREHKALIRGETMRWDIS